MNTPKKYLLILIGIINSFIKIGVNVILAKKPKVIFYYPQHFNRVGGKNIYFEPLITICSQNEIPFLVFEEPELITANPRNSNALPSDVIHYSVLVVRKVLTVLKFSFWQREKILAAIINFFTFKKFKVDNYITISGNMSEIFQCMNPDAKVFDVQHGIIYSTHEGYFNPDGKLRDILSNPNLYFLLSGDGYKNCFNLKGNNFEIMNRVHVIGASNATHFLNRKVENIILVTLQFVPGWTNDELVSMQNELYDSISQIDLNKYQVILKHHPRFANVVDLSDFLQKNSQIIVVNDFSCNDKVKLHITISSTTTFEFAQIGVPTFFMPSSNALNGKTIFYDEYDYPLYSGKNLKEVLERISDEEHYKDDCIKVKEWANNFYSPIKEQEFLKLIK